MQTVGDIIRDAREKKGLSLKDIENAINIRALYLNAIEESNFGIIPGEVYLKGFIRNYANYLGLNGQQMVDLYRQQLNPPPPKEVETPAITDSSLEKSVKQQETKQTVPEKRTAKSSGKSNGWILAILAIIALAALGWWFWGKQPVSPMPVQEAKPAPSTPLVQSAPTPTPPVPAVPTSTGSIKITAKFTDECWTLVMADGKQIYEGVPKIGASFTWEAKQTLSLKLGNANGIELTYNGKPLGKLGEDGEVLTKTFTANADVKP